MDNQPNLPTEPLELFAHDGNVREKPPRMLIRDRLVENGVAILAGMWGTFKTFVALDIAAAVMTGCDWCGEPVYRRGGVLFIAAEGGDSIRWRLQALVDHSIMAIADVSDPVVPPIEPLRLPFLWAGECPALLDPNANALVRLIATVKNAKKHFEEKFKLPLALIVIDTMSAAADFENENSNAEAARVIRLLRDLGRDGGALVMVVDHFGKTANAGVRGGGAKEGNGDNVLVILGKKQLNGKVTNTRLAIRKLRDGVVGKEFAFAMRFVDMGVDDHGKPATSAVVEWGAKETQPSSRSPNEKMFDHALALEMEATGIPVPDDDERRAVWRDRVRERFVSLYEVEKPGPDPKKVRANARRAFNDVLKAEVDAGLLELDEINGIEHIIGPASADGRDE